MKRKINRLVVHCTASSQKASIEDIKQEFKNKGWKYPGYHYLIDVTGKTAQLLDEGLIANGVKGYNSNSIHVAYIGGIDGKGKGVDNRTKEQKSSLIKVLAELKRKYPEAKIMGHRDLSPDKNHNGIIESFEYIKECPCFNAITEYKNL